MASSVAHPLTAGIEFGGTKCICILGTGPQEIREQVVVPTQTPQATLAALCAVLDGWGAGPSGFSALGLAAFGPLDLRPDSPHFGSLATTVKPGWSHTPLLQHFAARYRVPTAIDTDVNAAALAEGRWGGARGLEDFAYVTVGTGVGAGVIVAGRPVRGAHHTELGHIRIARLSGETFAGNCPFHGDCVEGLAAGPAIRERTGREPAELGADDPVWVSVAHALAQLCQALVLATGPRRIILGGGIMVHRPQLFAMIRERLRHSLNGYLDIPELGADLAGFIVPSALGAAVGPLGALALAAMQSKSDTTAAV